MDSDVAVEQTVKLQIRLMSSALLLVCALGTSMNLVAQAASTAPATPTHLTSEQDHQRMMDLLHITTIRRGADGDPKSPNAANYDESKATTYASLPDPLVMKNGKKVDSAEMWWKQRRPEIVEDFDRDIYGRVPENTPKVTWEVVSTTKEDNGGVPVITKKLLGHLDNSAYPQVTVNIDLTLSTPATAKGPVPVMIELALSPEVLAMSSTTGACCARGHGARAACSTILKPTKPWMRNTSALKVTLAMAKLH